MTSVTPRAAFLSRLPVGGTSVIAIYGPLTGGAIIANPYAAVDQELDVVEVLYISLVGPATVGASSATFAIQPGGVFIVPPGSSTNVWINAESSGHAFSAVVIGEAGNFAAFSGLFPPSGPTTITHTIPSYLYEEYADDPDLPAFVTWYNGKSQDYVDWFANISLPVYTGLTGALLDWIGAGLYGLFRPALPSGRNANVGPLNTWTPNLIPLNTIRRIGNQNFAATSDDVYKRILTWHFYKGDGKIFTVWWLKRRVIRFINGIDGISPPIDQTYRVSVTFGPGKQVNINLPSGKRTVTGGAIPNRFGLNTTTPNALISTYVAYPSIPLAAILKAAIESGALELPFQFTYVVNIS